MTVHGQTAEDVLFERFRTTQLTGGAEDLRRLAEEWSTSRIAHERYLGLLATAAVNAREEDFPDCLEALDSIAACVPATEKAIHLVACRLRSNAFTMLGDPARGVEEADKGLRMIPEDRFPRERVGLELVRAEGLLMQGRFDEAYTALIATEATAARIGFLHGQGGAENAMGLIRLNQRRNDEARAHFRTALELGRRSGSETLLKNVLANLGITATMSGDHAGDVRMADSLLTSGTGLSPQFRMELLSQKGVALRRMNDQESALRCFRAALTLKDSVGLVRSAAKVGQHTATALWATGRKEEAFKLMNEALADAKRLNWPALQEEVYIELHDWCDSLGSCEEALNYLQAYTALSDSLHLARYDEQLANSEALYGRAKQERRIAEQAKTLVLAEADKSDKAAQRNLLLAVAIALGVVCFALWRVLSVRRRLAEREKELHIRQVDELIQRSEIAAMNAMFEGQEQERDRTARDLHDRVGSMLGNVKMQMEVLEERMDTDQQEREGQYKKVYGLLVETVGEVRRISHDMVAGTLARFGLEKALEGLCDSVRVTGRLAVELRVFGLENRLERGMEITVYRIVQELVGNALKHAKASELSIDVTRTPGRLSVIVSDNGVGFDTTVPSEGMGLANVRKRAATVGGALTIDSTPGKGTTVSVECAVVE